MRKFNKEEVREVFGEKLPENFKMMILGFILGKDINVLDKYNDEYEDDEQFIELIMKDYDFYEITVELINNVIFFNDGFIQALNCVREGE
jgi:hypothetical protein